MRTTPMRALSLWQPWASLWALGVKPDETRHWPTSYRGPLAVHAAKRWTREQRELCMEPEFLAALLPLAGSEPEYVRRLDALTLLPFGAFLGVVLLTGAPKTEEIRQDRTPLQLAFGNYSTGRYAWTTDPRRWPLTEPLPARGQQGLWTLDEATEAEIRHRIGRPGAGDIPRKGA